MAGKPCKNKKYGDESGYVEKHLVLSTTGLCAGNGEGVGLQIIRKNPLKELSFS